MLDLLLPQRCLLCGAGGGQLCATCRTSFPRLPSPLCALCGAPTAWSVRRCRECAQRRLAFATARAAVPYDAAARTLVAAWKERGLRRLAEDAARLVAERVPRPPGTTVTFVPADSGRSRERGHHPAARLAAALAAYWDADCADLLERARPIVRQRGLGRRERSRNMVGAFRAGCAVAGAVVLVDDVYTSGATAAAAAAALRRAGAKRVDVVTFARTIRAPALGLDRH